MGRADVCQATSQILRSFREVCVGNGLAEARRRSVVSRHDPTIRFTNSTITVLKPALEDPDGPPLFLVQPALRLRNLDHFRQFGSVSPFGCSFHAFGALLPGSSLAKASSLARSYLVDGLGLPPAALILRGAEGDGDLLEAGRDSGWDVDTSDPSLRAFRHVFGVSGTTGRNVNVALVGSGGARDLGNIIAIERNGRTVAVEVAFGTNVILLDRLGLAHPILATVAADAAPGVVDLMALDALMCSAVLALDGLRPVARGRGGRYRQLLMLTLERHGGSVADVIADIAATIKLEATVRRTSSPLADGDLELPVDDASQAVAEHLAKLASGRGRAGRSPQPALRITQATTLARLGTAQLCRSAQRTPGQEAMTTQQHRPDTAPSSADARSAPSMQEVILRLQEFWADRGVLVAQPYNTEVGAGTANPATALRVLGPEPWHVAYVEPSVRPDDSRYGENPNRLQTHTQYQVVLKPAPPDPQEIYLASLEAIGINTRQHDVRFVEDNWASPALGAWGLGWEVWLDGLEITQFTYFQQAGGITLDPVAVEITYGLERIVMALQGISHFAQIRYSDTVSYGEVFAQAEYEMSRYYLDDADIDTNRQLFSLYSAEAERMLSLSLPVPAYTYVLKCSHTFNVLDSRGAISTTERARSFALMRRLTHAVSQMWVERRAELGHPLGRSAPPPTPALPEQPQLDGVRTVLVEIGVEELPHLDVRKSTDTIAALVAGYLTSTGLTYGAVTVKATPRRIVTKIDDVADAEPDVTRTVRGPRTSVAYDADGAPTKALLGFLRGQGVTLDDVVAGQDTGDSVAVEKVVQGRRTTQILAELVDRMVRALHSGKNMRWGDPALSFSRPIRWLLVIFGDAPVHLAVSTLASGSTTRVLRSADRPEVEVSRADGFERLLADHGIVLDRTARRAAIVRDAVRLANGVGGVVDVEEEADLIDEITDLVEDPRPILGRFEERYLELSRAVLTTVMRKHQRYLPVVRDGRMLPHFVTFANGPCDPDVVRGGNEAVIRARYEDASFFWRADLSRTPEEFRERLSRLMFEERLGSFDDRVRRIADLAERLATVVGASESDRTTLRRAGALGKFDLATQMVVELPSLAGKMAREYASRAGEEPAVAQALEEMEMPRTTASPLPTSLPGAILSLADRFDLITSMYAVGATPTGTSDPYGVRRTALGIVRLLRAFPEFAGVSVSAGVDKAADQLAEHGIVVDADMRKQAVDFVLQRYELQLLGAGNEVGLVRAVLPSADNPARSDALLAVLDEAMRSEPSAAIVGAVQRAVRILPSEGVAGAVKTGIPTEPAEIALAEALDEIREMMVGHEGDVARFLSVAKDLPSVVDRYFDEVRVLHPDSQIRAGRLGLLSRLVGLAGAGVDWVALMT